MLPGTRRCESRTCPHLLPIRPRRPATAILWGDSFADALQPAFDAASTQSNASLEIATVSGCAPIDVFPTPMRRIGQDSNPVPLATRQRYSSISRPRQRSIRS
jgi:hypothetical protein